MLRGEPKCKCDDCGNLFEELDDEDNATAGTIPMHCPKCGTQGMPKKGGWLSGFYEYKIVVSQPIN